MSTFTCSSALLDRFFLQNNPPHRLSPADLSAVRQNFEMGSRPLHLLSPVVSFFFHSQVNFVPAVHTQTPPPPHYAFFFRLFLRTPGLSLFSIRLTRTGDAPCACPAVAQVGGPAQACSNHSRHPARHTDGSSGKRRPPDHGSDTMPQNQQDPVKSIFPFDPKKIVRP